jgi:hypothetical protein
MSRSSVRYYDRQIKENYMAHSFETLDMHTTEITAVGIRCADYATSLYPQKLTLTLPTSGCRSVDIVCF